MIISKQSWLKYTADLRLVCDAAANDMIKFMSQFEDWTSQNARKAIIQYAHGLTTKYGDAAATLACEMYDSMAEMSGVVIADAEPAETASFSDVAKAVNGTAKTKDVMTVAGAIDRLVKRASVDTTMKNAIRDHAQWAWIPQGDTCAFCIALGSRGWHSATASSLKDGHAGHIHPHCDCTYAVRFNPYTEVEGYDPKKLLHDYEYDKDGNRREGSSKDKINAMSREHYNDPERHEGLKEKKRERAREYARRKAEQ